jgi:hypothetical protein
MKFGSDFLLFLQAAAFVKHSCAIVSKIGYNVLVDAGSTGSRVYIYKYDKSSPWNTVSELSHKRLHPALTTFTNDYHGLVNQMEIFVDFAKGYIEEEEWEHTDISLKATAGLRSISIADQSLLINNVKTVLRTSGFRYNPHDTRVITGKEEAVYGLIAVNAAFLATSDGLSIGAADLGGSSTQISFMIPSTVVNTVDSIDSRFNHNYNYNSSEMRSMLLTSEQHFTRLHVSCPADYELSLLDTIQPKTSKNIKRRNDSESKQQQIQPKSRVFARSLTGLGLISAMESVIDSFMHCDAATGQMKTADESDETDLREDRDSVSPDDAGVIEGSEDDEEMFRAVQSSVFASVNNSSPTDLTLNPCLAPGTPFPYLLAGQEIGLYGSGDFARCVELVEDLLRREAGSESTCMRAVRPKLIVGMDNLPKVLEIMHLAKEEHVSPHNIRVAGEVLCRRSWTEILHEFPTFMPYRAQRACFGAAYVYSLLTTVYGLDEQDNTTFLPLEYHKDYTLGWPLGSAIFSAIGLSAADLLDVNESTNDARDEL